MLARIFDYDNAVFRFITKVGYIWWLNILWIICSIPIITIGASTSALIYGCMKLKKEEGTVTHNFFHSFKDNLKQATAIWLLYLVVGILLFGDLIFWNYMDNSSIKLIRTITIACLVPYSLSMLYVFAVQAKFVNTVKRTIQYSFVLSIRHFKDTILMLVIVGAVIYLNVTTIILVNFVTLNIGIGILAYVLSLYYAKVFARYCPEG